MTALLRLIAVLLLYALIHLKASAQDTLYLDNPSFEDDIPSAGAVPVSWENRGPASETPPDIQPGQFNVLRPAQHGNTFIGMVVRDNNTWESVGQKLKSNLQKGDKYSFGIFLSRSDQLISTSRLTNETTNYSLAAILQIWGLNTRTGKRELLAVSPPVAQTRWEKYEFTLLPKEDSYDELQLAAYYKDGVVKPYNGNLLLDNCSPIVRIK